jgi:thiamine-phosphate pyrophosphorylase
VSEASLPRLLLVSPPLDDNAAIAALTAALDAAGEADVAALLLRPGSLGDDAFAKALAAPLRQAQQAGVAVLLEDRPDLVAASGADGLHLTLADPDATRGPRLKDLRARFGADILLGAGCGASRHLAMTAGEAGADYIGFGEIDGAPADPETLAWWEAVMTPPQVAFGAGDPETAGQLAAAGPDFLALGPDLWNAGGDPAAALSGLKKSLAAAVSDDS